MEISIAIAIVVGLTEVLKRAGGIPSRFIPLVSLAFGLAVAYFSGATDPIISGLIVGLSASGLFDIGKKTLLNK